MQRQIKFRARIERDKKYFYQGDQYLISFLRRANSMAFESSGHDSYGSAPLEQFTGHKTIREQELYEGDIVFVEEAEENVDNRYYLVIVWIPEWSMFASLHLDEYKKFISEGCKALDETMFWTYTLENAEEDFHYAGNIYQNPELLNK